MYRCMRRERAGFIADQTGSLLPVLAIGMAAIFGIVATSLALTLDSKAANEVQVTADAAVIAAATTFINSDNPKAEERLAGAKLEAERFATTNSRYDLVDLDIAAVTEDAYGQQTQIDIALEFHPANIMAQYMGRSGGTEVRREASAEAVWGFPLCALALATDGAGLSAEGSITLSAENCIVWANSVATNSMDLSGGSLTAKSFCGAGGVVGATRANPDAEQYCDVIPDPLADWTAPTPGDCQTVDPALAIEAPSEMLEFVAGLAGYTVTQTAEQLGGGETAIEEAVTEVNSELQASSFPIVNENGEFLYGAAQGLTLEELLQIAGIIDNLSPSVYENDNFYDAPTLMISPGTYCGLDIAAGHVDMAPGVYIIKDGPLTVRRRATLTGKGVTIIMSGNDAAFGVLDEARLTLTAPTEGATAGFALAEDVSRYSSAEDPARSRLTGSGRIDAIGTIYLPTQIFAITGSGAGDQTSPLLQIVADRIHMADQGELRINFDSSKTKVPVGIKPERTARLVN